MTIDKSTAQLTSRVMQKAALLAVIYVALIFLLPANKSTMLAHDLSALEYRLVFFAVTLPSLLTWFAALFGYAKLKQYACYVRKTREGEAFGKLAKGCGWLAWSLPIPALAGLLLNSLANQWNDFYPTVIIAINYLNLILPLVAFIIIGGASRSLVNQAKLKLSFTSARVIMLFFLAAGVLYCYLAFQQFELSSLASTQNAYHLPIWLMVLTVMVPSLYAWFVGLLAAYEINLFSQQVQGVLYRQALMWLALGLTTVIASIIALQYMSGAQPRVGYLRLNETLFWLVIFRIIRGCGFIMIAIGAIRLKKIEEV